MCFWWRGAISTPPLSRRKWQRRRQATLARHPDDGTSSGIVTLPRHSEKRPLTIETIQIEKRRVKTRRKSLKEEQVFRGNLLPVLSFVARNTLAFYLSFVCMSVDLLCRSFSIFGCYSHWRTPRIRGLAGFPPNVVPPEQSIASYPRNRRPRGWMSPSRCAGKEGRYL